MFEYFLCELLSDIGDNDGPVHVLSLMFQGELGRQTHYNDGEEPHQVKVLHQYLS